MRTVEEFTKIVKEENREYNERLLNMSPATLISRAWEIAKWQAIYDYIMERVIPYSEYGEDVFEDFLTLEIGEPISTIYEGGPISTIYEYELNYDEPMWTTWDGLDIVVRNMFAEIKNQNN